MKKWGLFLMVAFVLGMSVAACGGGDGDGDTPGDGDGDGDSGSGGLTGTGGGVSTGGSASGGGSASCQVGDVQNCIGAGNCVGTQTCGTDATFGACECGNGDGCEEQYNNCLSEASAKLASCVDAIPVASDCSKSVEDTKCRNNFYQMRIKCHDDHESCALSKDGDECQLDCGLDYLGCLGAIESSCPQGELVACAGSHQQCSLACP